MAYTTVFTKGLVRKISSEDYIVSINVAISEDSVLIKELTFSIRYNIAWTMDQILIKLQKKMKVYWDKYTDEQNILNKPALDTLISNIKTVFDTYINK